MGLLMPCVHPMMINASRSLHPNVTQLSPINKDTDMAIASRQPSVVVTNNHADCKSMIPKNWGYCDLSISKDFDVKKFAFLKRLGYDTIAINTFIPEAEDEPKKKKKKGDNREKQELIPEPIDTNLLSAELGLNILKRVTIEFSDSSIAHKMNQSENLKKYDILAVMPKTLQAFQYACGTMDIDAISFNPEGRIPFKISRKAYQQAVDRGVFFELMYGAAIKDSTARKNIISTSHNYHAVGKSRNIIISSGADSFNFVRGIYDVINLSFLFGLNSHQGLQTIKDNPRRLILRSEGRRCGKLYMEIDNVNTKDVCENDNKNVKE